MGISIDLHTIISVIAVLTLIIFIHELGHYTVAKLSGIKVTDFSIGFGPKIFSRKDKSGTEWKFCWIPLGGYIKLFGDADPTSTTSKDVKKLPKKERKHAFVTQNLLIKSAVVAAGPLANFLLSIVILASFFYVLGQPVSNNEITTIEKGSVAHKAGLLEGDKIIAVDGTDISTFSDIQRYVLSHPDIELEFTIKRNDQVLVKKITPETLEITDKFNNKVIIGKLGVGSSNFEYQKYNLVSSIGLATSETFKICALTLKALGQIITGTRGTRDLGSIIKITKYTAQSVQQGLITTLYFIAMFSINLGLINLLPIPPLDGGHLVFYAVEALFGEKICTSVRKYAIKIGFAFLIALMAFTIINDIIHP
jgi:regulator of sigma E protease